MSGSQSTRSKQNISPVKLYVVGLTIMATLLIVISSWATQKMAKLFSFDQMLGAPMAGHLYAPWKYMIWFLEYARPGSYFQHPLNEIVLAVAVLYGLTFFGVILIIGLLHRRSQKHDELHGTAHFADRSEIEKTGLLPTQQKTMWGFGPTKVKPSAGVYVGGWTDPKTGELNYLKHDGPEHIAAIAPTRSGKGVGLVIPTLLSWLHSVVINDMKGELWAMTSGWRKRAGNVCIKFDPASPEGSARFNPLAEVQIGTPGEVKDMQNIMTIIVDPEGKGLDSHWSKTGFALLVGVGLYVMYKVQETEDRVAGLPDVARIFSDPDISLTDLWAEMKINEYGVGGTRHEAIAQSAVDMMNTPDEERGSIVSTARSFFSLYRDPIVAANVSGSDFKVADLMDHTSPVSLYLVIKPSDKTRLLPLIRLMLTLILRGLVDAEITFTNGKQNKIHEHRLLMLLDEFPAFGRLKVFEDTLPYIAGYGIKAYLIMQDKMQMEADDAYGKSETITANCHVKVVYAPNTIEMAEWLSKQTGQTTVVHEEVSTSGTRFGMLLGNVSRSYQATARPLLTADECLRLKAPVKSPDGLKIVEAGDLLVFTAGNSPIMGTQSLFFLNPVFQERIKVPGLTRTEVIRGPGKTVSTVTADKNAFTATRTSA